MVHAKKEILTLRKMGFKSKVWSPLPMHRNSGHIHIAVLITSRELWSTFPYEANLEYLES